jgi:hypothetical protein
MPLCSKHMCPHRAMYCKPDTQSPTVWTCGDGASQPPVVGAPIHRPTYHNLCYYHYKEEYGFYTNKYCGKLSGPTLVSRSGQVRDFSERRRTRVRISDRWSPYTKLPCHLEKEQVKRS